jgi:orotate phosphoribosyltransferase
VLIVEDVVTAGTAVRHSIELLRASAAVELVGLVVGVDRMERGRGDKSALRELADDFGIDAFAIATIDDVVEQLRGREIDGRKVIDQEALDRIAAYRARYGAS